MGPRAPRSPRELTLAIGDAEKPEEVLALAAAPAMNGRNCLAALSSLGRARNVKRLLREEAGAAAAFEALLDKTWEELPAMGPDQQAQVLWALAKAGIKPGPDRRRDLFRSARGAQAGMSPQWHSSLLWAASKLQVYPGTELLAEAEAQVVARLRDYNTRDLGQILYAWAGLGFRPEAQSLERLLQAQGARLRECSTQTLANTVWSLAKLEHSPHPAFLEEVEHQLETKSRREKPTTQCLSTTLWSFCKLGHSPGAGFLEWVAGALVDGAEDMSEQQVGNVLWAYATAEWPMPEELRRVCAARAGELCPKMQPAALGQAMWGLAALGHSPNRWLLTNFHRRCMQVLSKSGRGTILNAARACEAFHHRDPELAAELCSAFERTSGSWALPQAAELVLALARLGYRVPDGTLRKVLGKVEEEFGGSDGAEPEEVSSAGDTLLWLAWSLGRLGYSGDVAVLHPLLRPALESAREARAVAHGFLGAAALPLFDSDASLRQAFVSAGMARFAEMKPHDIATFVWAAAESGASVSPEALASLEAWTEDQAPSLNRSDVVLLPWGLSRLGSTGPAGLRSAVAEQVLARQGKQAFSERELQGLQALAGAWSLPLPPGLHEA